MITVIDVNQRIEFVSKDDLSDPKTVFLLRPMTGSETLDLSQFAQGGELKLSGAYAKSVLKNSIVDIKNGPEGLSLGQVIEALPTLLITELLQRIIEINHMTRQDAKN